MNLLAAEGEDLHIEAPLQRGTSVMIPRPPITIHLKELVLRALHRAGIQVQREEITLTPINGHEIEVKCRRGGITQETLADALAQFQTIERKTPENHTDTPSVVIDIKPETIIDFLPILLRTRLQQIVGNTIQIREGDMAAEHTGPTQARITCATAGVTVAHLEEATQNFLHHKSIQSITPQPKQKSL